VVDAVSNTDAELWEAVIDVEHTVQHLSAHWGAAGDSAAEDVWKHLQTEWTALLEAVTKVAGERPSDDD
jgi:hypothetical protein